MNVPRRFTLVSFHAHPDDEALLTAGTLARAAADGHRVVLVTATNGEAGLSDDPAGAALGSRRSAELLASAAALGCARVVQLGFPDSGSAGVPAATSFAGLDVDVPAHALAAILREEGADALTIYDARGGYGHPDHVRVHDAGLRAAELAGTPLVLQATVDRTWFVRVLRLLRALGKKDIQPPDSAGHVAPGMFYSARADITHRIDVRDFLGAKRRALTAHSSQVADAGGGTNRTVAVCLRLPRPLFALVFRREWFVEVGRAPGTQPLDDIFATLR